MFFELIEQLCNQFSSLQAMSQHPIYAVFHQTLFLSHCSPYGCSASRLISRKNFMMFLIENEFLDWLTVYFKSFSILLFMGNIGLKFPLKYCVDSIISQKNDPENTIVKSQRKFATKNKYVPGLLVYSRDLDYCCNFFNYKINEMDCRPTIKH